MSDSNLHAELARLFDAPRPLRMADLSFPRGLRALVLAPHPDDFDAIGVTLRLLHRSGATIHLAVLTSGESGVESGFDGAQDNAAKGALREQEQRESCALFGLPADALQFVRLPQDAKGHPLDDDTNRDIVRGLLRPFAPHCVFLPHGNDSNVGHQRTYALFEQAARGMTVWAWLNRDAKTIAMRADLYTGFDEEEAAWKAQLLRAHRSQQSRNLRTRGHGFDERVLAMNRQTAQEAGMNKPFAEAFELKAFEAGD